MWDEMARLKDTVRQHVDEHNGLWISSLNFFTTRMPSSRVDIYVSGELDESCARLLAWRDTLTNTSLYLQTGDDPAEPNVNMCGRFLDGTAVTVTAPLSAEDVASLNGNQLGKDVLGFLTANAG